MNEATYDLDVIRLDGATNVQRLEAVQEKYDPDFVFQRPVPGGFKFP